VLGMNIRMSGGGGRGGWILVISWGLPGYLGSWLGTYIHTQETRREKEEIKVKYL